MTGTETGCRDEKPRHFPAIWAQEAIALIYASFLSQMERKSPSANSKPACGVTSRHDKMYGDGKNK
ncbi:MAG: hypothetical protein IPK62_10020 [Bacteroidetes bacterium]|nr:hypothetical protein [Bacteroidota bacterium]